MAEIKRIVKSSALSDFRQTVPDAGGGFRLMAELANGAYEFLKPAAIAEQEALGSELGNEIARQQIGDPAGSFTVSRMSAPAGPNQGLADDAMAAIGGGHDHATHAGQSHSDWLRYSNQGATRNKPLADNLVSAMSFLPEMGVTMNVVSGGQDASGPNRVGSTRHDHGNSADADFYIGDRKLNPNNAEDLPILTQIVQRAKANGLTGFGEGTDYMGAGRLHIGFGDAGVWGAGGKGANAPEWLKTAFDTPGAGGGQMRTSVSSMGAPAAAPMPPPTMLRQADGSLTGRLYSPLSGEILQAHNAAAGVAYQSEIMMKGATDIMALSEQFLMDPDGFNEAAKGYVDGIVKSAPAMFKAAVRGNFQKEAQRRYLGMVEERQRETRNRANNSSAALVDRWSDNLTSAIAGGNPDEIAAAQSELTGILSARETLPGVAWTREQSQNVVMKSQEAAQKEIDRRVKEQATTWKGDLGLIGNAAMNGQSAADESILQNPIVRAQLPEEWAEAAAKVMLRDNLPTFLTMTPAEQAAAIAEMKAQPVQADFELEILGAAEAATAENEKAWEADPILRAQQVLPNKPPALDNINPENPADAIKAMADRQAYADGLVEAGYVDAPVYLSDTEAEALGVAMSKETPPELRAVFAAAIVEGFGEGADRVFDEIKTDDPTTRYAGKLMSRGGDKTVAFEAMRGQAMLDEGLVQAPTSSNSLEAISPDIAEAMAIAPLTVQGDLRKFAISIYAARARGVTDAAEQKTIMEGAVQSALGQSKNRRGQLLGGVQTIGSNPVLMTPGVSGEEADRALGLAFSSGLSAMSAAEGFAQIGATVLGQGAVYAKEQIWPDGNMPMLGGKPLAPGLFQRGHVRLVPTTGTSYRMEIITNGAVQDARNAAGGTFEFDMARMIAATPKAKSQPNSISGLGISP